MTREIKVSFTQRSIPLRIRALVRCKICEKKATSYFITSGGRIVLLCEPCFQTCNLLYKRQSMQTEEDADVFEVELDRSATWDIHVDDFVSK